MYCNFVLNFFCKWEIPLVLDSWKRICQQEAYFLTGKNCCDATLYSAMCVTTLLLVIGFNAVHFYVFIVLIIILLYSIGMTL